MIRLMLPVFRDRKCEHDRELFKHIVSRIPYGRAIAHRKSPLMDMLGSELVSYAYCHKLIYAALRYVLEVRMLLYAVYEYDLVKISRHLIGVYLQTLIRDAEHDGIPAGTDLAAHSLLSYAKRL